MSQGTQGRSSGLHRLHETLAQSPKAKDPPRIVIQRIPAAPAASATPMTQATALFRRTPLAPAGKGGRSVKLTDALRFVEVSEKAGHMSPEEAEEWRTKIEAWVRFRCRRHPASSGLCEPCRDLDAGQ